MLGLGASTRALAEGFHDTPFEHPAAKLRDTVTRVRALLSGQPAQLHHSPAAHPLRSELGDGWIPALVARDRLPAWTAQLNRVRATTAPNAEPLAVACGPITAADENAGAARDIVATCVAWYLSAMGDLYSRSLSSQGYATEVGAILAANPRPSPRRGTVPPEAEIVLDQLAAYGTHDEVRKQLTSWDDAADIVTILLPPGMPWENIEATLLGAAPAGPG